MSSSWNLKSLVCLTSFKELLLLNICSSASPVSCTFSSRSHIGKAILSQPACVSKLLSLLLDQRPSPKLVLIILQLCRAALPLMSVEDCGNVELPPWSYSVPSLNSEQEDPSDPASKIASLLLAKLADYVVPGEQLLDRRMAVRCPLVVDSQTELSLVCSCSCASCDKREKEGRRDRVGQREEERIQKQCVPYTGGCTNHIAIFLFA